MSNLWGLYKAPKEDVLQSPKRGCFTKLPGALQSPVKVMLHDSAIEGALQSPAQNMFHKVSIQRELHKAPMSFEVHV